MKDSKVLQNNIIKVRSRLQELSLAAARPKAKLVGVTKTVPVEVIGQALAAGLAVFGENRVQEALPKQEKYPHAEWHFIGHLQTNKAKDVVGRFSLLHSLDRWKLARVLQKESERKGVLTKVLVQINIGGEKQKAGISPLETEEFLHAVSGLSHLRVEGLMAIPPQTSNAEESRPYFRQMYQLFSNCRVPGVYMQTLSLGMSSDYHIAVQEGANLVRVGSTIFGYRE